MPNEIDGIEIHPSFPNVKLGERIIYNGPKKTISKIEKNDQHCYYGNLLSEIENFEDSLFAKISRMIEQKYFPDWKNCGPINPNGIRKYSCLTLTQNLGNQKSGSYYDHNEVWVDYFNSKIIFMSKYNFGYQKVIEEVPFNIEVNI